MQDILLTLHNNLRSDQSGWISKDQPYDSAIIEQISDASGAKTKKLLTAIPSPFARLHLFETAFEVSKPDSANKNREQQVNAYDVLVSECLDVIELMYQYEQIKNSGKIIKVIPWDKNDALLSLMKDHSPDGQSAATNPNNALRKEHFLLGDALKLFLDQDWGAQNRGGIRLDKFFLLVYNNKVFAGTSPLSLFFTKPDIEDFDIINPATTRPFFSEVRSFNDRSLEFRSYLIRLFSYAPTLKDSCRSFYQYIRNSIRVSNEETELEGILNENINQASQFWENFTSMNRFLGYDIEIGSLNFLTKKLISRNRTSKIRIKSPKQPECEILVASENRLSDGSQRIGYRWPKIIQEPIDDRILPDVQVKAPFYVESDFLEEKLIELPYKTHSEYFIDLNLKPFDQSKGEEISYLLPIKSLYFEHFFMEDLAKHLTIQREDKDTVTVELKIPIQGNSPNLQEYALFQKKYTKKTSALDSYGKIIQYKIFFIFYPLFRLSDESGKKYNNDYRIMMIDAEDTIRKMSDLEIYKNADVIHEGKQYNPNFNLIKRNPKQSNSLENGSYVYKISSDYTFVKVKLPDGLGSGIIVPRWKNVDMGREAYNITVDFGTTNTYIAIANKNDFVSKRLAAEDTSFAVTSQDLQAVIFNAPKSSSSLKEEARYEDFSSEINTELLPRQLHEFIPSIIGDTYKFPIRTAISTAKLLSDDNIDWLGNVNISFAYEKDLERPDEKIITDLKWNYETTTEKLVEAFLEQLLRMLRNKILLNNGDPSQTNLLWFYPLSLSTNKQESLKSIFSKLFGSIFSANNNSAVSGVTESAAPYYYFNSISQIYGENAVMCVDIGGGSTDIAFFDQRVLKFGTSISFAGNSLWSNGISQVTDQDGSNLRPTGSGFVSFYANRMQEKIKNITDPNKQRTLKSLYDEFLRKLNRAEDLINFWFSLEGIFNFSQDLRRDEKIKFLILFHLSAIIYHSGDIMRRRGLKRPRFVTLSGKGSKYVDILDQSYNKTHLNSWINTLLDQMLGTADGLTTQIIKSDLDKEATAIGGLHILTLEEERKTLSSSRPENIFHFGAKSEGGKFDKMIIEEITSEYKKDVIANVSQFIKIFFATGKQIDLSDKFEINLNVNVNELEEKCLSNLDDFMEMVLETRVRQLKVQQNIGDSLFFYPLKEVVQLIKDSLYN